MKKMNGILDGSSDLVGHIEGNGQISGEMKNANMFKGADGESAYEIALKNGFVGTEAEWLESLKGYTPVKGVDYYTSEDMTEMTEEAASFAANEVTPFAANALTTKIEDVNTKRLTVEGVSPLEHTVKVQVVCDNILDCKQWDNGNNIRVNEDGSVIEIANRPGTGYYSKEYFPNPPIPKDTTMTISIGEFICDTDTPLTIHFQTRNQATSVYPNIKVQANTQNQVFTIKNEYRIVERIFFSVENRNTNATIKNVQLEYGTEASSYHPYGSFLENATVTEEKSGESCKTNENGIAEIKSAAPEMTLVTDCGKIINVEYNQCLLFHEKSIEDKVDDLKKDTLKNAEDISANKSDISKNASNIAKNKTDIAAANNIITQQGNAINQNTREISKALSAIGTLQSIAAKVGYIEQEWGDSTFTIGKEDYGIFIVISSNSTATYTCQNNGSYSLSGNAHIFVKSQRINGNERNCMTHIYVSKGALIPSFNSKQSYPISDVTITNTDSSSGMDIIRMPLRSPK